jgi:hypothetical protein
MGTYKGRETFISRLYKWAGDGRLLCEAQILTVPTPGYAQIVVREWTYEPGAREWDRGAREADELAQAEAEAYYESGGR